MCLTNSHKPIAQQTPVLFLSRFFSLFPAIVKQNATCIVASAGNVTENKRDAARNLFTRGTPAETPRMRTYVLLLDGTGIIDHARANYR